MVQLHLDSYWYSQIAWNYVINVVAALPHNYTRSTRGYTLVWFWSDESISTEKSVCCLLTLVITRNGNYLVCDTDVIKSYISDHFSVTFNLSTAAPNHMQQREQLIAISGHIYQQVLERDLVEKLAEIKLQHDVNTNHNSYTDAINYIMNKHAPVKTRVRRNRERQSWFTDDIHHARQLRKANERRWRATGLEVHRQIYVQHTGHSAILFQDWGKMTIC